MCIRDRVEASKIGAADKGYVGHKAAKMMKHVDPTLELTAAALTDLDLSLIHI